MANKTNLISSINTQLTALITQAKVRLAASLITEELYPEIITDTNLASTVLIKNPSLNLAYNVSLVKTGRMVFLKGSIKNNTAETITDLDFANFFFKIENQNYVADAASVFNNKIIVSSTKNVSFQTDLISIGSPFYNSLFFINNIAAGETVYFNAYYFTKN